MARRAAKIAEERKKGQWMLLLDAGDSLVGDNDPARKTQGQTSVAVMNRMGYDAMALGPQDLSLGPAVLGQRITEAQFALLSANAIVSATGKLVATPYVLREFGGRQVALIGLSGGNGTSEIAIRDPLATARSVVAQVADLADMVILLSHAGASVDQQIAEAVPGITLIVSGGAFAFDIPWRSAKTGTLILHADEASPGHAGRRLGIGTFAVGPRGQLTQQNWQRIELSPQVADDPAMSAWVQQQLGR